MTAFVPKFFAVKKASADWPGLTTTARCAGEKRQGSPSATSELKVTVISRDGLSFLSFSLSFLSSARALRLKASFSSTVAPERTVPPKPVAWQKRR